MRNMAVKIILRKSQKLSEEQRFILLSLDGLFCKETSEGWEWDLDKAQKKWDIMSQYGLMIEDPDLSYVANMTKFAKTYLESKSESLIQLIDEYEAFNHNIGGGQEALKCIIKEKFSEYAKCFDSFFLSESIRKTKRWHKIHGFIPKNHVLFERGPESLGDKKIFRTCLNRFSSKYNEVNAINMALNCSTSLERNNLNTFFKVAKKHGHNDHDAVVALRGGNTTDGKTAIDLMRKGLTVHEILEKITANHIYDSIPRKDENFFNEAKKFVQIHRDYDKIEERWLKSDRTCLLPVIKETYKGNKLFLMDKNDPRGLFLGDYTACCQHPDGAGEDAAWYGVEKPNAGFYVVEDKKGNIWAQAMAWIDESGKYLVLDSVESIRKDNPESAKILFNLFGTLSQKVKDLGLTLTVGRAFGTAELSCQLYPVMKKAMIPKDLGYSDADEQLAFEKLPENNIAIYEIINELIYNYNEHYDIFFQQDRNSYIVEEIIWYFGLKSIKHNNNNDDDFNEYYYPTKNISFWHKITAPMLNRNLIRIKITLILQEMGL